MNQSNTKSVYVNTLFLLGSRYTTIMLRALYLIFVAKVLGPDLFGVLNLAQSTYLMFIPLFQFGFGFVLSKTIGRDPAAGRETAGLVLTIRLLALLFIASSYWLLGYLIAEDTVTRSLFFIMVLALIGRCFTIHNQQLFTAYEKSKYSFYLDIVFRPLEVGLAIMAVILYQDIVLVAAIHSISWLLQGIGGFYVIRKQLAVLHLSTNWRAMLRLIKSSFPIAISILLSESMLQWPVVTLKGISGSESSLGNIALLNQGILILLAFYYSLASASVPVVSRALEKDTQHVQRYISLLLRLIILAGVILYCTGSDLASLIILTVFGKGYAPAAQFVSLILICIVPAAVTVTFKSILLSMGKYRTVLTANLFSAVVFFPLVAILPIDNEIKRILTALIISYTFVALLEILVLIKLNYLSISASLIWVLVCVAATVLAYQLLSNVSLVLAAISGVIVPLLFLPGYLEKSEKVSLTAVIRRFTLKGSVTK